MTAVHEAPIVGRIGDEALLENPPCKYYIDKHLIDI